ncbi:ATPase [Citromicrobium bathyomarinum]|jgi:F-type H+-transporting ATPase subunit b|uniref:ATP synthase subunit b n=1 Tax=Alteriqipengyuania abyssalis TaxID=2860200 RepID=A0ABS7PGL4_9SPHN|nr:MULTISPECIES: H+-transporting two-sector ATPase B/B' subunit [Sphingomonadales]MAO03076.1 ATPase [Citromicrobium sp.]MEC8178914.1 ATPase [Pseudomonadota bacterium]ALG61746.1 ATPase [Citromicrobium sp. JL477]KPM12407.1 ATPase [Citromicrobium sp. JL1351]KPM16640.1 ATPase [Citromicrobium sp. JL31]|tara:strand:+ start:5327 stop:5821 length:495 start_codon:yes stop_codon:yes gene_type:complete
MPQIDQLAETFSSQAFWLLVFFGISFFVVGRGMVPKVSGTMERRSKQIADDIAAAQAARDQADQEEEAWRVRENENRARAQALIAEAKAEAAAKSEKKIAAAQKRLDKKLEEADQELAAARAQAMGEIEAVATDAAQDIVARIAGITVTKPAAGKAVKEAMAHG